MEIAVTEQERVRERGGEMPSENAWDVQGSLADSVTDGINTAYYNQAVVGGYREWGLGGGVGTNTNTRNHWPRFTTTELLPARTIYTILIRINGTTRLLNSGKVQPHLIGRQRPVEEWLVINTGNLY